MLRSLGMLQRFPTVVLGEECVRAKPFPDPYLGALKALGLQAGDAVVLEDSPTGKFSAPVPPVLPTS
jgi:beta-phosphoglucomutase-like phosphatase (HAD superfamily)